MTSAKWVPTSSSNSRSAALRRFARIDPALWHLPVFAIHIDPVADEDPPFAVQQHHADAGAVGPWIVCGGHGAVGRFRFGDHRGDRCEDEPLFIEASPSIAATGFNVKG